MRTTERTWASIFFLGGCLLLVLAFWPEKRQSVPLSPSALHCGAEEIVYRDYQWFFVEGGKEFENGHTRFSRLSRSGKYCAKTDSSCYTAMAYTLHDLKAHQRFRVSVWRMNVHGYGYLVADGPWEEMKKVNLADSADEKGWERLRLEFEIPENAKTNSVKIYVMAKDNFGEPVYFDDLLIEPLQEKAPAPAAGMLRELLCPFVEIRERDDSGIREFEIRNHLPLALQLGIGRDTFEIGPWDKRSENSPVLFRTTERAEPVLRHGWLNFAGEVRASLRKAGQVSRQLASRIACPDFLRKKEKVWTLPAGEHILTSLLYIPEGLELRIDAGCHLDLREGGAILSFSPVRAMGNENDSIRIQSSDHSGGIAVIQADGISVLQYVAFSGLGAFHYGDWQMTGAICFEESELFARHCSFSDNQSEDALNLVRTAFLLHDCIVSGTSSDGLDVDFGTGFIRDCRFVHTANDGADFSGSKILLQGCHSARNGDKGFSIGEGSKVVMDSCSVEHSQLGIGIKDRSLAEVSNSLFRQCVTALHASVKKAEFGPAFLLGSGLRFELNQKEREAIGGSEIFLH